MIRLRKPDPRLASLEAIVREQEVADFLGMDHGPSTVQIIDATADMIVLLERHAERQFAAPAEEIAS